MRVFYCIVTTGHGVEKAVVKADNGFEAVRKALARYSDSKDALCSTSPGVFQG